MPEPIIWQCDLDLVLLLLVLHLVALQGDRRLANHESPSSQFNCHCAIAGNYTPRIAMQYEGFDLKQCPGCLYARLLTRLPFDSGIRESSSWDLLLRPMVGDRHTVARRNPPPTQPGITGAGPYYSASRTPAIEIAVYLEFCRWYRLSSAVYKLDLELGV
ncbi:hypothetical protein F5X99DRAFT_405374 [Biscogniauxia marginata]|nr:hypothetical protein F5X99DRAFT_405374 [Biscogniauxia marginata]